MAFIDKDSLKTEMTITGATDDALLTVLATAVLSVWDDLTNKVWATTTHNEFYSTIESSTDIFLNNFPVTGILKLGHGVSNVVIVYNTNKFSTASVAVTSTGISLILDGVVDDTVVFVTYTTISTAVAAVNALGSGWTATVVGAYGDLKSTELVVTPGKNCINSTYAYLTTLDDYLLDYTLVSKTGHINYPSGFWRGINEIYISYIAGYTDGNVPSWLKETLVRQACHWFMQARERRWHVSKVQFYPDGGTIDYTTLVDNMLPDFKFLVDYHRRKNI